MTYYHTQEHRGVIIKEPIECNRDNAWLGTASYFWECEMDAVYWGQMSKRTKYYDIYKINVREDVDILDTVFNRKHYEFWVKQIEKVSKKIIKKTNKKPSLRQINGLLSLAFKGVDGVLFQDISKNPDHYLVREMQYKKRIQLALYNKNKIKSFRHHYKGEKLK